MAIKQEHCKKVNANKKGIKAFFQVQWWERKHICQKRSKWFTSTCGWMAALNLTKWNKVGSALF